HDDAAGGTGTRLCAAQHRPLPRAWKDRDVKVDRLLGFVAEPQAWTDFLHLDLLTLIRLTSSADGSHDLPCCWRPSVPSKDGRSVRDPTGATRFVGADAGASQNHGMTGQARI